jgi:hypothetical protein
VVHRCASCSTGCKTTYKTWTLESVTEQEFKEQEKPLLKRNSAAKQIHETFKLHDFIWIQKGKFIVNKFFTLAVSEECWTAVLQENMTLHDANDFVACVYDNIWWLECVMIVNENSDKVTISIVHPHDPSPSYVYLQQPNILSIHLSEVLMKVYPRTAAWWTYTLILVETQVMIKKLKHTNYHVYKQNSSI